MKKLCYILLLIRLTLPLFPCMYQAHTSARQCSRQDSRFFTSLSLLCFSAHRVSLCRNSPVPTLKLKTESPRVEIRAVCEVSAGNNPNCNGKLGGTAGTKHWQRFNSRNNKIRTREHPCPRTFQNAPYMRDASRPRVVKQHGN